MSEKQPLHSSPTSEGQEEFKGHTPGPWSLAPFSEDDELISVVAEYSEQMVNGVTMKQAHWIAECDAQIDFESDDVEKQLATNEANARLIAAAPDLLRENTELRASLTAAQAEIERLKAEHAQMADYIQEKIAQQYIKKARSPVGWYCACGWANGINLAECACCSRRPGGPQNPCTIFTADGAQ